MLDRSSTFLILSVCQPSRPRPAFSLDPHRHQRPWQTAQGLVEAAYTAVLLGRNLVYILEGRGFDMHDGIRYDWEQGDAVAVHNDSVHWHNNADPDNWAVALIFKAKPLWLFLGLQQQGPLGTAPAPDDDRWEAPREFSVARAADDIGLQKVLKPGETPWLPTSYGRRRLLADAGVPLRVKAVDVQLQELAPGGTTAREWQMADELFYVLDGQGMTCTGMSRSRLPTVITRASLGSPPAGTGRKATWSTSRPTACISISTSIRAGRHC